MPKTTSPNKQQLEAVRTTEGPLLIIAGPGSGKTYTLVERVFHLINEKNLEPQNLLVATFTEKAAAELITRISNKLIEAGQKFNVNEMYVGTIHSICLRILEDYREHTRFNKVYTVMDQFDQQYFIYQKMKEYDKIEGIEYINGQMNAKGVISPKSRWKKSKSILDWINKINEENVDIAKLAASGDPALIAIAQACALYHEQLEAEDALDFSTIQLETLWLFERHPEVLKKLQEKIRYFMIDEYQDTNTIQESIILTMSGKEKDANICVVGDDDQGLYRFRGATIRNILEFPANFPESACRQIKLVTNYRSHPAIIQFYNQWMNETNWTHDGKSFRFDKTIEAPHEKEFPDITPVFKVSGQVGESNWFEEILAFLNALKSNVLSDLNQVAFLFSSVKNNDVTDLAAYLEENGVPRGNAARTLRVPPRGRKNIYLDISQSMMYLQNNAP